MIRFLVLILTVASAPFATAHTDVDLQLAAVTQDIQHRPNDYSLYILRGELRRHKQDWRGAEADFARAERLGTDEIRDELPLYRGRLFQDAGLPGRAVAELDAFLAANPQHVDALRVRALANADMGAMDAAISDYSRLIDLDSARSPELWLERARLWMQIECVDLAIASIDEATAIFGPLTSLVVFTVESEVIRHNYAAALERIDKLPPGLAETPEWLLRRGEILDAMDQPDEAVEVYMRAQQAISRMPLHRQKTVAIQDLLAKLRSRVTTVYSQD